MPVGGIMQIIGLQEATIPVKIKTWKKGCKTSIDI